MYVYMYMQELSFCTTEMSYLYTCIYMVFIYLWFFLFPFSFFFLPPCAINVNFHVYTCVHSNAMTDSHNDFYMQTGSELALPEPRQQSADEEE